MKKRETERFERQLLVTDFGEAEQERLRRGRVLVVGAGGLGSAALAYLAAGGVGRIGIVEFDVVSISNLQRQTLYTTPDLGKEKIAVAAERLRAINPDTEIVAFPVRLTDENAEEIAADFDVIVDCTDNYATRYVIDRCCAKLKKPMIYGTAQGAEGQISVFHTNISGCKSISYTDLYPPQEQFSDETPVGVLSPMPGIVGSMQAMEAIKVLTGYGATLAGKLLVIDAKLLTFNVFHL